LSEKISMVPSRTRDAPRVSPSMSSMKPSPSASLPTTTKAETSAGMRASARLS
jgi:hypothetical protein